MFNNLTIDDISVVFNNSVRKGEKQSLFNY